MTGSSLAGVITAVATMITAIGGFVAVFRVLTPIRRETKEIHTIVNQQHTDLVRRVEVLSRALTKAGVELPEDQSKPGGVPDMTGTLRED